MSRRRVLSEGHEPEVEGRALGSINELLVEAEQTRLELPEGSAWDEALARLQQACNTFRTEVEAQAGLPFRASLAAMRVEALRFAASVNEALDLREAAELERSIDDGCPWGPLGQPERVVYIEPPPNLSGGDERRARWSSK